MSDENEEKEPNITPKKEIIPIHIADDVLQQFVEWVPLKNLPNLLLANRRFWKLCDEELDKRRHTIYKMKIKAGVVDKLVLTWPNPNGRDRNNTVPFPEVEPPQSFKVSQVELPRNIGQKGKEFLRLSKQLFVGALLKFNWEYGSVDELEFFLEVFDKCSVIELSEKWHDGLNEEFFAKPAFLNCNHLIIDPRDDYPDWQWDPNPVFDWLHTPPATADPNSNGKRQIWFLHNYSLILAENENSFLPQIKKKFIEAHKDEDKRRFVIMLYEHNLDDDLKMEAVWQTKTVYMVNESTGEVLFTRIRDDVPCWCELVRCNKGEEDTIKFDDPDMEENPNILVE